LSGAQHLVGVEEFSGTSNDLVRREIKRVVEVAILKINSPDPR